MAKKAKFLFLIIFLIFLFVPIDRASAFIGTGVFDFFDSALGGIEEMAGPVAQKVLAVFFTYIFGLIFLATSTNLLELTLNPNWLHLKENAVVSAGWDFTAGLANMLMVLILIVIAFSFILKLENLQMKKALPRLLGVALLINFSLVFIGMLIDGSNIIYNTFLGGNRELPNQIVQVLGGGGKDALNNIGNWILALGGLFIVPFIAPFAQLSLTTVVVTGVITGAAFLTNFLAWFFQIFAFFTIGGIFLAYAILFAARVFIIQVLAILAPLAFLALILPQTKKYWDKWLHTLLEWTFFGIFLFFFMVLGLKLLNQILPPDINPASPTPFLDMFKIEQYFIYYFFLCLYLIVMAMMSKKMMPAFAQAVLDQVSGFAKMAWGRGILPLAGAAKTRLDRFAKGQKDKEDAIKAEEKLTGRAAQLSRGQRMALGMGRWMRKPVEWGHKAAGTSIAAAVDRDLDQKVANYEKRYGKDFVTAAKLSSRPMDDFNQAALALYLQKAKGGKAIGELSDSSYLDAVLAVAKYSPHRLDDIAKYRANLLNEENAQEKIQNGLKERNATEIELGEKQARAASIARNTMVSKGMEDENVTKMKNANIEIDGTLFQDLIKTEEGKIKAIREAFYKKAITALKNEDVDNLTDMTLNDSKFQEMVIRYQPLSFIRKIGEEKGSEYIKLIHDKAEKMGAEEIMKTNEALLRSAVNTPAFNAVFPPLKLAETKNQLNALNILRQQPGLRGPYIRLQSITEARQDLKREENVLRIETARGAPPARVNDIQARINNFRTKINQDEQQMILQVEQALGGSADPKQLQKDWARIEQVMQQPKKGKGKQKK